MYCTCTYTVLIEDSANACKEIYKSTGVKAIKLTHDRTAAIQYAGSEGLAPYQINTFTNHILDKLNSAYQSVSDREVSTKNY